MKKNIFNHFTKSLDSPNTVDIQAHKFCIRFCINNYISHSIVERPCPETKFGNSDASSVGITGVYGDSRTVTCDLGYVTEADNDQLSYTTSCDEDGQWTFKYNCTSMYTGIKDCPIFPTGFLNHYTIGI